MHRSFRKTRANRQKKNTNKLRRPHQFLKACVGKYSRHEQMRNRAANAHSKNENRNTTQAAQMMKEMFRREPQKVMIIPTSMMFEKSHQMCKSFAVQWRLNIRGPLGNTSRLRISVFLHWCCEYLHVLRALGRLYLVVLWIFTARMSSSWWRRSLNLLVFHLLPCALSSLSHHTLQPCVTCSIKTRGRQYENE